MKIKYYKKCLIILFATSSFILITIYYYNYLDWLLLFYHVKYTDEIYANRIVTNFTTHYSSQNEEAHFKFDSKCLCRREKLGSIYMVKEHAFHLIHQQQNKPKYKLANSQFKSLTLTCDMYNSLSHGPGAKVVSYSLYGKNKFYYDLLKSLALDIRNSLPEWRMRVYYDSSVDMDFVCEMECLNTNNVDFCNIEALPLDLMGEHFLNMSFMHGMTWRWLPLGDSFINRFSSRDSDVRLSDREIDSINVWLKHRTQFHIMRDHPQHNIMILGGMWGMATEYARFKAKSIFDLLTNKKVQAYYNKYKNEKAYDQHLLTDFVSNYVNSDHSTIHDSYWCGRFEGSRAWPSKRPDYFCFVGCPYCCEKKNFTMHLIDDHEKRKETTAACPYECRPLDHKDWLYC
jgi:hypothetical protein